MDTLTISLCGDVMTGRGVDQILPHPGHPRLHEPYVNDAREYVRLAQQTNGAVPCPVDLSYIWGDALAEWNRMAPDARIANLETSITQSDEYWKGKGIHYRMHPDNIACLVSARFDVCALANNHVLDYGRAGLVDTLHALETAGIRTAGAGRTLEEARRPAVVTLDRGNRVIVAACGDESSGIPDAWAAREGDAGVDLLADLTEESASAMAARITVGRRPGDIVLASIHWGSNWGFDVSARHVAFARRLVDGGVDLVYGHSSHHVRPIEIYRNRLILYGCGDFMDDYEGIRGYEEYRGDLALMYFATVDAATGWLVALRMTPMQMRRLRVHCASSADSRWLCDTLNRISAPFGVHTDLAADGSLGIYGISPRTPSSTCVASAS